MSDADFVTAVKEGDAARVEKMLLENPSLAGHRVNGVSVLLTALYHGKRDVAKLIAARAGALDFYEAAAMGDVDRIRELVAADPENLRRYSADGFAPLGFATFFGHPEVDRFLIDAGADVRAQATNAQKVGAIHAAAAVGNRDMIALLLERGADPNAVQADGFTPLHEAAMKGDQEMAALLLGRGADRTLRTFNGKTPADVALEHGHATFAEWLTSNR